MMSFTRHRTTVNNAILTFTKRSCRANESHLAELARAMITASKLPEFLQKPAIAYAAYLRNMSYIKT